MKLLALPLLCLTLCVLPLGAAGLAAALAEPDLEKRSEKATQAAAEAFTAAKKLFREGDKPGEGAMLTEIREAVNLASKSLEDSHKDARRSPKYFKKAEIALRKLLRDLDDLRIAKSVDDRKRVEDLIAVVIEAHDKVLLGIMTKKK